MTLAQKLSAKLELEAACAADKKWHEQRLQVVQCRNKAATRTEQSRKTLHRLRARTAEIKEELDLRAQVAHELEQFCKAQRALREKNRTVAERKAYDAEIQRGQLLFSKLIPELSPNWREEATLHFKNRKV